MFTNPNTMLFSPKVFWIEKTWSQADFPNQKVFAKIKQLMKKHYHVEYLYEKYP